MNKSGGNCCHSINGLYRQVWFLHHQHSISVKRSAWTVLCIHSKQSIVTLVAAGTFFPGSLTLCGSVCHLFGVLFFKEFTVTVWMAYSKTSGGGWLWEIFLVLLCSSQSPLQWGWAQWFILINKQRCRAKVPASSLCCSIFGGLEFLCANWEVSLNTHCSHRSKE